MGKNRKNKKIKTVRPKKGKVTAKRAKCKFCQKLFAKESNLSSHIESAHKGKRWICNLCGDDQASKFSHIRHFQTKHPDEPAPNTDGNEFYLLERVEMTEKSKAILIRSLANTIKAKDEELKIYKENYLNVLKENIVLKERLGLNVDNEKKSVKAEEGADKSSEGV